MYDKLMLLCTEQVLGNAADEYTDDPGEINFGITTPAVNRGGNFGLHAVVTTAFTGMAEGAILWICHGAATTPTTKHTGMFVAVGDLKAGAHFFIPCGSTPLLQYARGLFDIVTNVATAGAMTMWFGPEDGGSNA